MANSNKCYRKDNFKDGNGNRAILYNGKDY